MTKTVKQRALYWLIIISLLIWVAIEREQTERYRHADKFLRADNAALRLRCRGL